METRSCCRLVTIYTAKRYNPWENICEVKNIVVVYTVTGFCCGAHLCHNCLLCMWRVRLSHHLAIQSGCIIHITTVIFPWCHPLLWQYDSSQLLLPVVFELTTAAKDRVDSQSSGHQREMSGWMSVCPRVCPSLVSYYTLGSVNVAFPRTIRRKSPPRKNTDSSCRGPLVVRGMLGNNPLTFPPSPHPSCRTFRHHARVWDGRSGCG